MRKLKAVALLAGPVIALSLSGMVDAAALPAVPYTVSGNVARVATPTVYRGVPVNNAGVPLILTNVSYFEVAGKPGPDGGFVYPYQISGVPGQTYASIELAYNTGSHTELVEVGIPTAASVSRLPAAARPAVRPLPLGVTGPGGGGSAASAYYEVVWHDPVFLSLAIVKDTVNWTYGGGTVANVTGSQYVWGFQGSYDVWHPYNVNFWNGTANGNTESFSQTRASFWNSQFCNAVSGGYGGTTYINVYENNVHGYNNGTYGESLSTQATGGCAFALGYYTIQG